MRFLWLGKFQSDAPDWTHPARELGEYELMIVDHGTLYIADHSQTQIFLSHHSHRLSDRTENHHAHLGRFGALHTFLLPRVQL